MTENGNGQPKLPRNTLGEVIEFCRDYVGSGGTLLSNVDTLTAMNKPNNGSSYAVLASLAAYGLSDLQRDLRPIIWPVEPADRYARIIAAIDRPFGKILSHPGGRSLNVKNLLIAPPYSIAPAQAGRVAAICEDGRLLKEACESEDDARISEILRQQPRSPGRPPRAKPVTRVGVDHPPVAPLRSVPFQQHQEEPPLRPAVSASHERVMQHARAAAKSGDMLIYHIVG